MKSYLRSLHVPTRHVTNKSQFSNERCTLILVAVVGPLGAVGRGASDAGHFGGFDFKSLSSLEALPYGDLQSSAIGNGYLAWEMHQINYMAPNIIAHVFMLDKLLIINTTISYTISHKMTIVSLL